MNPLSRHTPQKRQRGAALLAAMLTVALVATLAAGAMWQQWRAVEAEGIERQQAQARWLLLSALDWARVILREDARADGPNNTQAVDHLAEPWAVPLQQVRLSSFLSALPDGVSNSEDEALSDQVFLSGHIIDLQSRLNVTALLSGDKLNPGMQQAFERLFSALGLPQEQLQRMVIQLLAAQDSKQAGAPLMPQRVSELTWLGLTPQTLSQLQTHITVLPVQVPVNVNTASAEVLYACVPGLSMTDAQNLVQQRARNHWASLDDFKKALGRNSGNASEATHSVNTKFFEVYGRLSMAQTTLIERSVVQRDQADLKVLWRDTGQWAEMHTKFLQ
jgi:general secretion pathway protein K